MFDRIVCKLGVLSVLAMAGATLGAQANAIPKCEKLAMDTVSSAFNLHVMNEFKTVDCFTRSGGKTGNVTVCELTVVPHVTSKYIVVMPPICDSVVTVYMDTLAQFR